MSDSIIEIENLSKQYRLGQVSTGTLSHDLNRLWCRLCGKDDPYLKVTQANDRTSGSSEDYVWALQDINFEVKRGEVLGIIGRNGAGKSTLLKILSRVTAPTTGEIRVDGRIASLLEVGTGFHPELTGRENIFLNGSILGMTKAEISSKLDEIVEFSGCARYLDTPVKRYSSGMMVRLGFAVAAHLEPEILIVDEVLAVGDAEFQKKCLGKMQDVASHGRTVLFVSHNMGMINQLCSQALVIEKGEISFSGLTRDAISRYYDSGPKNIVHQEFHGPFAKKVRLNRFGVNNNYSGNYVVRPSDEIRFDIEGHSSDGVDPFRFTFGVFYQGVTLFSLHDLHEDTGLVAGDFKAGAVVPAYTLRPGVYEIGVGGGNTSNTQWFYGRNIATLTVLEEWDERCEKACTGLINIPSRDPFLNVEKES